MSLTDPRAAAAERDRKLAGSGRALAVTVAWGLAGLVSASFIGFGVGGMFDQMRVMAINSVFGNWNGGVPLGLRAAALPVGILGSIVSLGAYSAWNHRYTGRRTYYAILGPASIVSLGLTVGILVSLPMWAAPDAVGVALDPTFQHDEPWDAGTWVMYAGIWWLPGLFALLTILSASLRLRAQRFRRRNADLADELLRSGRLVDAEVTSAPAPASDATRVAGALTLAFDDARGVRRWVTCLALLPSAEIPVVGDTRPLVFDAARPGDVRRILVSPTGDLAPGAFVAVRAA